MNSFTRGSFPDWKLSHPRVQFLVFSLTTVSTHSVCCLAYLTANLDGFFLCISWKGVTGRGAPRSLGCSYIAKSELQKEQIW